MRTGVRHLAAPQIIHEILQLLLPQRVVGLHRVAADGLDDYILAKPQSIHPFTGCLQLVHQLEDELPRVRRLDERRQRVEQEGSLAELAQPHAKPVERLHHSR